LRRCAATEPRGAKGSTKIPLPLTPAEKRPKSSKKFGQLSSESREIAATAERQGDDDDDDDFVERFESHSRVNRRIREILRTKVLYSLSLTEKKGGIS